MKIEVLNYIEEDSVLILDIDQEAKEFLLERGINSVLLEALDTFKCPHKESD